MNATNDYITLVEANGSINKSFENLMLADDEPPRKSAGKLPAKARARTLKVPNLVALDKVLRSVGESNNQCIILGYVQGTEDGTPYQMAATWHLRALLGLGEQDISVQQGFHDFEGERWLTRTRNNFTQSSWIVFDYDRVLGMPAEMEFAAHEDWIRAMSNLVPGWEGTGYLLLPSNSSRVLKNNKPAKLGGGWHAFVQVEDATDVARFGTSLLTHSLDTPYGFRRPIFNRTTNEQQGSRPWAIFDPCTLQGPERPLFEGRPQLWGPGLSVAPVQAELVPGGRLNTRLTEVSQDQAVRVAEKTGYDVQRTKDGAQVSVKLVSEDLTLDTLVITRKGKMTVRDFWESGLKKVRAQSPFRKVSKSWAAFLNRHHDGVPFLFDTGTSIKYVLGENDLQDQRLKIALDYVKNETSSAALARNWANYCEFLDHIGTDKVLDAVQKRSKYGKRVLYKTLEKARQQWAAKKARQERKRARELAESLGKRQLQWKIDEAPALVDQALAWIREDLDHGLVLNYGGVAVEIVHGHPTSIRKLLAKAAKGNTYPDQELIMPLSANTAAIRALKSIQFLAENRRGHWSPIDCPNRVSRTLVERPNTFLPLSGLLEAPTFRPDGSPIIAPGYDKSTGFYAIFPKELGRAVPDKATRDQAITSLQYLQEVFFEDFPFESDLDAAVAVAMLLTAFVGRFLPRMPGFIATAGTQQTGKSTLINATCLCTYGRPAGAAGWTDDQTEMRKVITSLLLEGQSSVCFDNLPFGARVDGDEVAKLITEEVYEGRILGGNSILRAPANLLVMITGNQLSPINDMVSRLLTIRMNAEMEDPSKRKFRRVNIEQWVEDHRAEIIGHVATIFRAWHQVGKTEFNCDRRTRFPDWDELVRFPLMWLGLPDVAASFDLNRAEDPHRESWAALYRAWHDEFGSTPVTAAEIIQACNNGQIADAVLAQGDGALGGAVCRLLEDSEPDARHLGNKLRWMRGNVIGDYKLEKMPHPEGSKKPVKWRVVALDELQSERIERCKQNRATPVKRGSGRSRGPSVGRTTAVKGKIQA